MSFFLDYHKLYMKIPSNCIIIINFDIYNLIILDLYRLNVIKNITIPKSSVALFAGSIDERFYQYMYMISKSSYEELLCECRKLNSSELVLILKQVKEQFLSILSIKPNCEEQEIKDLCMPIMP